MASTTPNIILLQTNGGGERTIHDEALAGGTITPGMLLTWSSGTLIANATAADVDAAIVFADLNPYLDPTVDTGPAIDTTYLTGEVVRYFIPQRGDKIYALLEDEGNVAKGAALQSDGAGALEAYTSGRIVAFADEAVNNTGGSGAVRIKVRAS